MIFDSIKSWQIYHFSDGRSNKIWGVCQHDQEWYAFWCGVNQAISFKSHGSWDWELKNLADKKARKGYEPISMSQLKAIYPTFEDNFNERFTWFKLSQTSSAI